MVTMKYQSARASVWPKSRRFPVLRPLRYSTSKTPLLLLLLLANAGISSAQSAENVAVVINEASADSRRIGQYYIQKRDIPDSNVIRIKTTVEEQIALKPYLETIDRPIREFLVRKGLQDRILYLVLTKGIPLRINGSAGRGGTTASVDSDLTLIYRRLTGRPVSLNGPVPNPYFLGTKAIREAQPFSHRDHDVFLVARLDGFTVEDVFALIDRGVAPSTSGRIVLDQRSGIGDAGGDLWLDEAAARLRDLGHAEQVVLESTGQAARDLDSVIGYYSWGSNDPQNRERRVDVQFVPGALASMFVSTDARTFRAPPADWKPVADSADKASWFAGSPQSLAGDLIRQGVTGIAANVTEPFLDGAVRPQILFPAYLAGFNLVESFYLALPNLSWQTVVIGDPLCAPFRKAVLTRSDLEEAVDAPTELPGLFGRRRLDVARAIWKDAPPTAVALAVRAETRLSRGDKEGATKALEEATALAPGATGIQVQLAMLYESMNDVDSAIERYRLVLKIRPNEIAALNNLAYTLAVKRRAPAEALPLAKRAVALAPNNPVTVDTLAWIQHLIGQHAEAARLLRAVTTQNTGRPEIHLHAAMVFAAVGDPTAAKAQLAEALKLDANLAERDDVKALLEELGSQNRKRKGAA